jgi:pentapeptide repeat protein
MAQWTREQLEAICAQAEKSGRPANFRSLKLHGADFNGMNLEKADFRSASCPYANFTNTNCKFAQFEGAELMFSKWNGANLHRTNFKDASLCDVDFRGVKDFFGATFTMECRSWKGMKVDSGFWNGFLFYGLLMEPPTPEDKDKLTLFFGAEKYEVLKNLYTTRQM